MTTQLTATQQAILAHAHQHTAGKIEWFPENIKGGARQKVLDGLFNRALITKSASDWLIAAEGYDALGVPRKGAINAPAADTNTAPANPKTPRTRENSKQAQMIELLKRSDGATLNQLIEATGWQAHTVRGAMAGALKKKLGLTITSDKATGQERTYRISSEGVTA
ncbi:DUF3489 domain-containing protein [Limnohabitans sp. TEGF004]|uniref:DUF3489 domain-containing protein n=1 Tax=Limnohabitans sp. TEGF004 TaxID=2986281 RepID=UPI0024907E01|nr:DUF3489 domain-containing protein [Limnohabitans sp. TEGF004]